MATENPDIAQVVEAVREVKQNFEAFKEAANERSKELLTKGAVDTLLEEKLTKINEALTAQQTIIDQYAAAQRRQSVTVDGEQKNLADLDFKALAWANLCANRRGTRVDSFTHENVEEYKSVFTKYLRKDDRVLTPDELKALSVGSDPDGGYVVDPDTTGRIIQAQFETSPMRQYASVQMVSSDVLEGLYDLDEADSGWVSETGTRAETGTPQFKEWRIPVHEQYAEPRATQKLVDDAYIDIEMWLAGKIADKLARTENAAFVSGDGVGKPRGFLTYTAGTTYPGQMQQTNSGANGAFVAAPNSGDILITVQGQLKSKYKPGATWFMNRTTHAGVRLLKDSNGQFLWQPSLQAGSPATLLGDPVASFDDMASYTTTGALAIAYGDMGQAYQIVDRMGIRVLRDPFTAKPWIKFYTTKRVGGAVVDFEALKLIKFSA